MAKVNERHMALKILEKIEAEGGFANKTLDDFFYVYPCDERERHFIERLVYGTIEKEKYLDFCLNQVSKTPVKKMKPVIRHILRLTAYQILFMDKVPSHAAINEAVKLTIKRKLHNLKGFVNGVSRSLERQKESVADGITRLPIEERLSIQYSIDVAIVSHLLGQYTKEELEAYLKAMDEQVPITVFARSLSREDLAKELQDYGLVRDGFILKEALLFKTDYPLDSIPVFQRGQAYVQDESAALVGLASELKKGEHVLDVCAAPGGKSIQAALAVGDSGKVISCDISEYKVGIIRENATRLSLANIEAVVHDATNFEDDWNESFDTLIVDVPCSGLGLLRKKPDIKKHMTLDKMVALTDIQQNILRTVAPYVKKGGHIIYSTCTINKEENEAQIHAFLKNHSEFELVQLPHLMTEHPLVGSMVHEHMLTVMTQTSRTDGFFIAKLKRKE